MCNLSYVSYEDRLLLFGLEWLKLRRLRHDLIEMFTIVNHFTDNDSRIYNVYYLLIVTINTRGHRFKLATVRCNKDVYKYFLINRIASKCIRKPVCCVNTNLIYCLKILC